MSRGTIDIRLISNGDMSANISSAGVNTESVDNVGVELSWTGTPSGAWKIQASNSSTDGSNGTWTDLSMTIGSQPTGAAGGFLLDLNQFPFKYVRIVYTKTSGTGTANAYLYAKGL